MQWEHLTSDKFAAAVGETGVCIIAMGVVERHGTHLPLETKRSEFPGVRRSQRKGE